LEFGMRSGNAGSISQSRRFLIREVLQTQLRIPNSRFQIP